MSFSSLFVHILLWGKNWEDSEKKKNKWKEVQKPHYIFENCSPSLAFYVSFFHFISHLLVIFYVCTYIRVLKSFYFSFFFLLLLSLSLLYSRRIHKRNWKLFLQAKIEIDKAEIWSQFFPPFLVTSCLIHFTKLKLLWIIIWNIISVMWIVR